MSAIKIHERFFHRVPHDPNGGLADAEIATNRRRHVRNVILFCWAVIAVKSVAVVWAVGHYNLPFNPLWVIGPTVTFAALATIIFILWKD